MLNQTLYLKTSIKALLLFIIVLSGSLLVLFMLNITILLKLLFAMAYISYGCLILRDNRIIREISCSRDTDWQLFTRNGALVTTKLRSDSIVTSHLCLLRFQCGRERYGCLIFKDSLAEGLYRRLLVQLKISETI